MLARRAAYIMCHRCTRAVYHVAGSTDGAIASAISKAQTSRTSHAATINTLANALHGVFTIPAGDNGTRRRLREACIDYLSLGGANSAGPVGLLSGLTPKPEILVTHFFLVALYAMRKAVLPFPTPVRVRQGYDLLHVACMIIMPLLKCVGFLKAYVGLLTLWPPRQALSSTSTCPLSTFASPSCSAEGVTVLANPLLQTVVDAVFPWRRNNPLMIP